jgi:hypothetical protein
MQFPNLPKNPKGRQKRKSKRSIPPSNQNTIFGPSEAQQESLL